MLLHLLSFFTLIYTLKAFTQHQHIAIFNSSLDVHLASTISGQHVMNNTRLLTFDNETHFLFGTFHNEHHSTRLMKRHTNWMTVEPNQLVRIADASLNSKSSIVIGPYDIQLDVPSWGLSRISQRQLPLVNAFGYPDDAGKDVDIYIVDSGVDIYHQDFQGRASWGNNLVPGSPDTDENGHGTIIAGIAAGKVYGVAKKANIIAVKCLAANGTGDVGTIIEGLHYILKRIQSGPQPPRAVINLSLVAEKSDALNQATDALTRAGAVVVVASGNYHEGDNASTRDSCKFSPSSASTVISVGSTDEKDNFASFSNDGKCVSILAPGTSILSDSASNGNTTSHSSGLTVKTWYSGTSYSAPHVAGVAALLYNQKQGSTNVTQMDNVKVTQLLYSLATPDLVNNVTKGTVNLLLYNGVETSQMSSILSTSNQKASNAPIPFHYSMLVSYGCLLLSLLFVL